MNPALRFFLPCLTTCLFIPAFAQEATLPSPLNDKMITFRNACLTERVALKTKNQITMGKALKLFKSLHTDPFVYTVKSVVPDDALGKPVVQFSSQYCDQLMRTEFSIVPLDSLQALREETFIRKDLHTCSFSLKGHGKASIAVNASGNCAMMAVSEDDLPLSLSAIINGNAIPFNSEEDGTINWLTWQLPKGTKTEVTFNIENPNSSTVSFTVAIQ